ncbi:CDP-diacylglycerol--glycerol-3-phosphate 3-phosphatidyltransferase [Falseniella ignava]|uniref:CDP-diacylglycerol--glycerol-3-phosphate 3-phosphatidyltransferase n=2 Tax=Falseniella ignava TaxID=137730 RepID=A0A2I1JXX2_9LACT|nr:CDP-diacylglycerol--glycerol-3-phosphate 3-phosphatidyltransferase [Falseniella ignava]
MAKMNIANKLTILRMCLIPVFIILMYLPASHGDVTVLGSVIPVNQLLAAIVFIIASLTDFLDGYLARKLNLVTAFGEFFDPMADKLLVIAAFIVLVEQQRVPAWIVLIIISRELLVTGLRVLLARSNGKVMAAALPGKIKTFTQMFSVVFYLLNNIGFALISVDIAYILLILCLIFTVYSGIEYFYQGRFVFSDSL